MKCIALCLVTGCLSVPTAQGIPATGEPLAVASEALTQETTTAHQVGTATTDSGGTVGIYEIEKHHSVVDVDWTVSQGNSPIDDEDFFRIAGDRDAADDVQSHRSHARWFNRISLVALAGGLVTSLIGGMEMDSSSGQALFAAGTLLDIAGCYGLIYSMHAMSGSNAHGVSLQRAVDAANRYNAALPPR